MSAFWIPQKAYPKLTPFSKPFKFDNNSFIVAGCDGIYMYHINTNKWSKKFDITKYSKDLKITTKYSAAAYDSVKQHLYLHDGEKRITKLYLKTNTIHTIENPYSFLDLIWIQSTSTLHGLGQLKYFYPFDINKPYHRGEFHLIYDNTKHAFTKMTNDNFLKPLHVIYSSSLTYMPKNQCILLFTAEQNFWLKNPKVLNKMYRFSLIDSKWQQHIQPKSIPIELTHVAVATTSNEKHIIFCGGRIKKDTFSDKIFIYDTKHNTFTTSRIKCPVQSIFYSFVMNDAIRDDILTSGFVRDCYKSGKKQLNATRPLPDYLIRIIGVYFCSEEIYLLDVINDEHTQWKINIDHLFA